VVAVVVDGVVSADGVGDDVDISVAFNAFIDADVDYVVVVVGGVIAAVVVVDDVDVE